MRRRTYSGYSARPRRMPGQVSTLMFFKPHGWSNSKYYKAANKRGGPPYAKQFLRDLITIESRKPGPRLP